MKKQTVFNLSLVLSAFVLMACTCSQQHVYYSPPSQNVPMIKEKGEWNAELGGQGGVGNFYIDYFGCDPVHPGGVYFMGAYSPKENLGVTLNFMSAGANASSSTTSNNVTTTLAGSGKGFILDAGAGCYRTLGSLKNWGEKSPFSNHIILELYGGIGYSSQHHTYSENSFSATADLNALVFYLQPAIGINIKWLTLAVSLRQNNFYFSEISNSDISSYSGNYYNYVLTEQKALNSLRENPLQSFYEPAVTLRAGWKKIKLSFQYCVSETITKGFYPGSRETERISLGISINIAPRYLKKIVDKK